MLILVSKTNKNFYRQVRHELVEVIVPRVMKNSVKLGTSTVCQKYQLVNKKRNPTLKDTDGVTCSLSRKNRTLSREKFNLNFSYLSILQSQISLNLWGIRPRN